MTSPFSQEAVQNGAYTKFVSVLVMALVTLGAAAVVVYSFIIGNTLMATSTASILFAGITFFAKAAGMADGAAISQQTISQALPTITDAVIAVSNSQSKAVTAAAGSTTTNGKGTQ